MNKLLKTVAAAMLIPVGAIAQTPKQLPDGQFEVVTNQQRDKSSYQITVSATVPGCLRHEYEIHWGDGSFSYLTPDIPDCNYVKTSAYHTYSTLGSYLLTLQTAPIVVQPQGQ